MFQSKHYQHIFEQQQLGGFEPLWNQHVEWFEEPNRRRGGWSGVEQLTLPTDTDRLCLFVKKQQNHGRRTLLHPFTGEPTFRREYKRFKFLEKNHIKAPKVVFYDEKNIEGKVCAILATEALLGFEPLDDITKNWHTQSNKTRQQKRLLLKTVAMTLRAFHDTGLAHRALYPKHIFVKNADTQPEIALIDLEKSRFSLTSYYRAYFDLAALHRHAEYWTRSERLYFFLQYLQVKKMTKPLRFLCRRISKRSARP